jgi:hypothetical protein
MVVLCMGRIPVKAATQTARMRPPYRSEVTREVYFYSISLVVVKFACCFRSESSPMPIQIVHGHGFQFIERRWFFCFTHRKRPYWAVSK